MTMGGIRVAAIIPARMASSRFPGKPLLEVHGLPMIEHVRRRTLLCRRFAQVVVATCDSEIAQVVQGFGGTVIMTSAGHPAATDRVAEAIQRVDCTHVINVQGDEILVLPSDLERMVEAIERAPDLPAWNAVARLERAEELSDRSIVKCAVSSSGRILFCARDFSNITFPSGGGWDPIRKVLGILGYRRDVLSRYSALCRTPMEEAEAIDQSRLIEHDLVVQTVEFGRGYPGINEPRELTLVQECLSADARQQHVLAEVLAK